MKRIQSLRAPSLGRLDGGSDKPALVPVLDLPQAYPDDAACHLTIVDLFHERTREMKTTVFL